ncbi:hypothetical protein [Terriglobus sp. RCC_193]|uniref:hypothetical protein n=1 Tax=Terriglobus sp. RCC_193 TaxID=3239218 RepID=UPI0035251C85
MQEVITAPTHIALDAPRFLSMKAKDAIYRYHIRRVTAKEWKAYYAGILSETVQVAPSTVERIYDEDVAGLQLVNDVLLVMAVRPNGEEHFADRDLDAAKIPLRQRIGMSKLLASATSLSMVDAYGDEVEVKLSSLWSAPDGTMHLFETAHTFVQPGIEHVRKFRAGSANIRVGKRDGMTINSFVAPELASMAIYDDLIVCCSGYMANGAELEGKEAIVREMDGHHKAVAARALFSLD